MVRVFMLICSSLSFDRLSRFLYRRLQPNPSVVLGPNSDPRNTPPPDLAFSAHKSPDIFIPTVMRL